MSKYLNHIGKNLPKYANKEMNQDEYGFISNPFSEGGMLEILNPVTAVKSYSKKGVAAATPFFDELKDYKQVRDEISNRPLILRKAARKMRGVRFDQSMEKKISNYKYSGWSNILSQTPTSPAEANAIVAAMFYIGGNIYQKNELLKIGDEFLKSSEKASTSKDITASLKILDQGVDLLKKKTVELGVSPAWYNIPAKITNAFSKSNNQSALNTVFSIAEQMHSKEEIDFAEAMRAERMEDSSPLGQLAGVFGIAIGGIVLVFTAPIWIPLAKGAVTSGAKLATSGVKSAGKLITKGAKGAAKSTSNFAKDSAKDIIKDSINAAKQAAEDFDTSKFQRAASNIVKNMANAGVQPNNQLLAQNEKLKRMLAQKSTSQQEVNQKKQEMKKMISQVVSQMKDVA
jgi:hypothetical protein